jgi:hypothetical protein
MIHNNSHQWRVSNLIPDNRFLKKMKESLLKHPFAQVEQPVDQVLTKSTPRRKLQRQIDQLYFLKHEILSSLDSESVLKLKNDLAGGVLQTEFVRIMLAGLKSKGFLFNSKTILEENIINALISLFKSMDLNGNGTLDFGKIPFICQ